MWATLLKVRNPDCAWCHQATLGDPQVQVKVLSHFPSGSGHILEEIELAGAQWRGRLETIRGQPSVHRVTLLESSEEHARVRLEIDECPLQHAVAESGALPRFPFEVRAGFDQWLIISERQEASKFAADLRSHGVRVEVVSSREYHPHENLTERQRELMQVAIAQGYYEVPRRVTLTKLAERLHVSKSTLSETLARAERRVLEGLRTPA